MEIGIQNGHCFSAIVCEKETGVDPDKGSAATIHETSDEFFSKNKEKFDVIFLDGLHVADQVERDIINSLACLSEGGTILMHDCKPENKHMQEVPLTDQNEWTGNVWEAFVKMRMTRDDITMRTVFSDWGVGIIRVGTQEKLIIPAEIHVNYENFAIHNAEWLNLVSVREFIQSMES